MWSGSGGTRERDRSIGNFIKRQGGKEGRKEIDTFQLGGGGGEGGRGRGGRGRGGRGGRIKSDQIEARGSKRQCGQAGSDRRRPDQPLSVFLLVNFFFLVVNRFCVIMQIDVR